MKIRSGLVSVGATRRPSLSAPRLQTAAACFVAAVVLITACAGRAALALTMIPLSFADAVSEADRIVRGHVVAVHSGRDESDFAVTWVTIAVAETLKGPEEPQFTFKQLSAPLGGDGFFPRYQANSEVVLFLRRPSRLGLTSPVGFAQGYYIVAPPVSAGAGAGSGDGSGAGGYTRLETGQLNTLINEVRALIRDPR